MNIGKEQLVDLTKNIDEQQLDIFAAKKKAASISAELTSQIESIVSQLESMDLDTKVGAINEIREAIHEISPFKTEPVDFVKWIKNTEVNANDYNPNSVAPPEMELLRLSISKLFDTTAQEGSIKLMQ